MFRTYGFRQAKKSNAKLHSIYAANFFFAFHLFLVAYVNSTFLGTLLAEENIGIVYTIGAIGGLLGLFYISRILNRWGATWTLVALALLELLLFLGIAFLTVTSLVLIAFVAYLSLFPMILYTLDIFLESSTEEERHTGNIRGAFITTTNIAVVISPIIAGFILGAQEEYSRLFFISALLLIPFMLIVLLRFRSFEDPSYHKIKLKPLLSCVAQNKSILKIFKAHLIMRLFFVWMIIYMPIYLHQHIGFGWSTIGIILTIMLLPYLIIELPAGRLADSRWGEKELLSIGFVITAFFVGAISFVTTHNVVVWIIILLGSRVGAALIEIMTETYFFKHVDQNDANTISCFRMLRPISIIVGSLVGTAALLVIDIQYSFLVFAAVVLWGLVYSMTLKDTR
jgi:MFS family permease